MTKYLKYIFVVSFICNFSFADDIDSGWNNFQNSLLNDLSGMENSFSTVVEKYNAIDGKLDTIINYANSLPSDYTSIKSSIVNYATQCKQFCSYGIATVNDLRTTQSAMVNTVSDMDYPSVSGGSSSVDPSITNDLKTVVKYLSKIQEYDSATVGKLQELIQTNRPIRDSMTNLLYFVQHNILSSMSAVQYNTSQISSNVSSILSELSTIESKFDSLASDVFGIRYTLNRFYNSFTGFLDSWLAHADHQDNFYYVATNRLNDIISILSNFSFTNTNTSVFDYSAITGIITNFPSEYFDELGIASENLRITDYRYWSPNMTAGGTFNNRYFYNTSLGDNLVRGAYYYILDDPENYNPFIIQLMLSLYNSSALTALNNWQYLLHTNQVKLVENVSFIKGTLSDIESHTRDIQVSLSTNNLIQSQQLLKLDYIQSLFSNNVPVASLNLDRHQSYSSWYDFFTNFYFNVSFGWDDSGNTPQYSSWQSNTNWFNRIEALLAALVFKDDNSGKVTNVVSTSATESAVTDTTTTLRSVVEIDNSFSQNVSSSANTIIDMLTVWTRQITDSAQLKGSFDMFHVPHMDTDDGQVLPQDSPSSGDWTFRIGVQDSKFGDFIQFIRSLTTVLWLCVFMFFALKISLFLLICICKFVYFCYVVFSAMMGGD